MVSLTSGYEEPTYSNSHVIEYPVCNLNVTISDFLRTQYNLIIDVSVIKRNYTILNNSNQNVTEKKKNHVIVDIGFEGCSS